MRTTNKIISGILGLILSSSALAVKPIEGVYFGAYGAGVRGKATMLFTPSDGTTPTVIKLKSNQSSTNSGKNNVDFTFGLVQGYAIIAEDSFYFAGEIGEELGKTTLKTAGTVNLETLGSQTVSWQLEQREFASFSVIPGMFLLDNMLVYGRAGVAIRQGRFQETIGTTSSSTNPFYERAKIGYGMKFGGGVAYAFTSNVMARLEYTYETFPKLNFTHPSTSLDPTTGGSFSIRGSNTNQIGLTLQYIFGSAQEESV